MKRLIFSSVFIIILVISFITLENIRATEEPPFGGESDVAYAKALWEKLEEGGFNSTPGVLQEGNAPHGKIIETLEGKIDGKTVLVKRNYGGEGVSIEAVEADRTKYLAAITIMAKRDEGYDSENMDWFWVKYKPNGEIDVNPKGVALAGRVAKGAETGCIACHKGAGATEMVFSYDESSGLKITKIE